MAWLPETRWRNRRLSNLAPAAAADMAYRLFCAPALSPWRHPRHRALTQRARHHLRAAHASQLATPVADLQLYRFEPDAAPLGTVLIVHGWTSEASFMAALAEPLRRSGYRVVLMDLPAHGLSTGMRTNLIDCARAVAYAGRAVGPLHAIVAHSIGGMAALLAMEGRPPMPWALPAPALVTIACPNRLSDITAEFADAWGLTSAARRAFERRVERVGQRALARFTAAAMLEATGARACIIHARDDTTIAFRCAAELAAAAGVTPVAFDGLGHSNILFAPQVARTVVSAVRGEA